MKADSARAAARPMSPGHSARIRAEQVRTLYQQAPLAILSSFIMPPLLVVVLWDVAPRREAIAWLVAIVAVGVARTILMVAYRRSVPGTAQLPRWGAYYLVGTLISGCVWGAAGPLLFVPGALGHQVILALVLGGMCTGAVGSLGAYLPAYYSFSLPIMLPYAIVSLVQADRTHVVIVLAILFYLAAMGFFARNFNRALIQAWVLRFENIDLVTELTVKKEEAERANVAKSRFLAAASHDLRQPLHAMALFVSALKDKSHGRDALRIVEKLAASVESLEELFHALLDVSKLDAGIVRPEVRDFRLQMLFDRVAREYAGEAAAKGLRLRLVPTRLVVRSDATLLERILRNLVSNGIRYTNAGGVLVGCRRLAGTVRIEVLDSGIGIDPAHREDIFQEFYQVGNLERDRRKGLGLGLAIVNRLATLLNHTIEVRSIPGHGSLFSVRVARGDPTAVVEDSPHAGEFIDAMLGDALVVVIDDEQAVLDGMREVLQKWGACPLLASSADEALARLTGTGQRPAVVVADYRLREGETGIQAIARIQATHGTDIPGVLITGDTAAERLREAEASGYHLLHKPVRPVKLRALLSFLLSA